MCPSNHDETIGGVPAASPAEAEPAGFIPGFADWVRCIRPEPWMGRAQPLHHGVDPGDSG